MQIPCRAGLRSGARTHEALTMARAPANVLCSRLIAGELLGMFIGQQTKILLLAVLLGTASASHVQGERINHEGRILGPEPSVLAPALFNTSEADAVMSAVQLMPVTNAFNEDVSGRPLHASSDAIIARITSDLSVSRRSLRAFAGDNFVLVPDAQPTAAIRYIGFPDESDGADINTGLAVFPFPGVLPLSNWPRETGSTTLVMHQESCSGDCRSITFRVGTGDFWETWQTARTVNTPSWEASNGARWSILANTLRPPGWASAIDAGLPVLPGLVRYDEVSRGAVEHALLLTVQSTRGQYVYPATHKTASNNDLDRPRMGERLRLKSSFEIPEAWPAEARVMAMALKKYGALVAENRGFFSVRFTPDDRYPPNAFAELATITIDQFEVIEPTGENEGPRSVGAPTVDAGVDRSAVVGEAISFEGVVTGTGTTITWYAYPYEPQPGTITFGTADAASTTATFDTPGDYTVMLKAADGVHAIAFDAVIVHVTAEPTDAGVDDAGMDASIDDAGMEDAGGDAEPADASASDASEDDASMPTVPDDAGTGSRGGGCATAHGATASWWIGTALLALVVVKRRCRGA
jgi:hypothetical protein